MEGRKRGPRIFRTGVWLTLAGLILLALSAPTPGRAQGRKDVITGGTVRAPIYAASGLLATLISEKLPGVTASVTTGQGFTALEQVHKGDAQIGFVPGGVWPSPIILRRAGVSAGSPEGRRHEG